jgi:glycosyltransferase involved in cell wall biosynthesis
MKKTILLMPTLNEKIGLTHIYPEIPLTLFERIVVLDGNSTDGTQEWCQQNNVEIFLQTEPGLRGGLGEFIATLDESVDFVLTFSPDGNCDPSTLKEFMGTLNKNPNARLVMGSRYGGGATSADDDFLTGIGNWTFTKLSNLFFRSNFTDVFSIYRAFDPKLINELGLNESDSYSRLEKLFSTRIPWEPLMSYRVAKHKLAWVDVPVGEPPRIGGERKLQMFRWGISFLFQLIRELWYTPNSLKKKNS